MGRMDHLFKVLLRGAETQVQAVRRSSVRWPPFIYTLFFYSLPNMKSSTVILSPFQVAPLMSLLVRETMKARRIVTLKPVLTGRLGQTGLNAQSLVAAGRGLRYKDFAM